MRWDDVIEKNMDRFREGARRGTVSCSVWWVQDRSEKERTDEKETQALKNIAKQVKHLEISGGLREYFGMKTYLHGPMDYAKTLKLRFRVGDLDLPESRKG